LSLVSLSDAYNSNEVKIAKKIINHNIPGLIPIACVINGMYYDSINDIYDGGKAIIITKFCNKGNLHHCFKKLDDLQKIQALRDTWKTLTIFHEHNFAHEDVKSDNILVNENEKGEMEFYVSDFGCTRKIKTLPGSGKSGGADIRNDTHLFGVMIAACMGIVGTHVYRPPFGAVIAPDLDQKIMKCSDKNNFLHDERVKKLACQMIADEPTDRPSDAEVSMVLNEMYRDIDESKNGRSRKLNEIVSDISYVH
ncbi:MAG: protein kinase, partial [Verrucomicrobia bacterium]|nr:protein kinase [Verrucomicrobiota bacterium]